jgi:hypothetical protein
VEPNYEKQLETLDDLLHSDVIYGDQPVLSYFKISIEYPELTTFLDYKKSKQDCEKLYCISRMITKRDIAMINSPLCFRFFAKKLGTVNLDRIICSFDENIITVLLTVLCKKGNPLLDRFNILMRRYLEAGFQERVWADVQHRVSLKSGGRIVEAAGDTFFPFSISHLKPAFFVLLVGTVLSSVVFIGELIVNCLCKRRGKVLWR